jgi:hypothetical protein
MASMLLIDGQAAGQCVSVASKQRQPFRWRDPQALNPDPDQDLIYVPLPMHLMGHVVWVGFCGNTLPPPQDLFDILMSPFVKQCTER